VATRCLSLPYMHNPDNWRTTQGSAVSDISFGEALDDSHIKCTNCDAMEAMPYYFLTSIGHARIFSHTIEHSNTTQRIEPTGGTQMKIKPLGDRVLLMIEKEEEKTKGGLFIPETAQEKTQTGVIKAVGDDTEAITVKVGDKVMYDKYAGTNIKVDGAEHLIVKMQDLIAVVE